MLQMIIPTRGRVNNQLTLRFFPKELREITTIVCPKKEVFALSGTFEDVKIEAQPDPTWTIAQKRVWIMQEWSRRGFDKIFMLDDDLRFATRESKDKWNLRECTKADMLEVFTMLEQKLGPEFPHVGLGPRQGNNRIDDPGWKIPGKMCYVLGYYLPIVLKECELGRIGIREDMELTLQLLLKGYPNAVWNETVVDQREFGSVGGASLERTIAMSDADAVKLSELFPGYVSVSKKSYKSSVPRMEVVVQWQKALQDGMNKKNQMGLF